MLWQSVLPERFLAEDVRARTQNLANLQSINDAEYSSSDDSEESGSSDESDDLAKKQPAGQVASG